MVLLLIPKIESFKVEKPELVKENLDMQVLFQPKIKVELVNAILTARLPMDYSEYEIDLAAAFEALKHNYSKIRYNPEDNFKAMFISWDGRGFAIFKNGAISIRGKITSFYDIYLCNVFLKDLWEELRGFVRRK